MNIRGILLGTAACALLASPALASASNTDARLDQLEQMIQDQNAEIQQLKAEQAAGGSDSQQIQQTEAQVEAIQNQLYESAAADKSAWWHNTTISGRMYFDLTSVENRNDGASPVKNVQDGTHFDIKRFYVSIDHKFDDVWSADITTDFLYDTSQCTDSSCTASKKGAAATQIYIKKAYLQGKFDDAAMVRIGSFDMPWIPFAEDVYGYRYIENTLVDRIKYGNSADWGVNLQGKFAAGDATIEYSGALVNGAGYKKPGTGLGTNRSHGMDVEGRVDVKYDGFVAAIGGYEGKLGKDAPASGTHHTYSRFDAILGYVDNGFHVGVEYFSEKNFDNVTSTSTLSDTGDGWSGFAAYQFDPEWAVFGRYDDVKPTDGAFKGQPKFKNTYYNVGIEWTPVKIVNLSLVYKHDAGKDGSIGDSNGTIGGNTAALSGHYDEVGLFGQLRW